MLRDQPQDLLLDDDDDLEVRAGGEFSSGVRGIAQGIRIAVKLVRGEWFFDLDEGVALFEREGVSADQALLGGKFDRARAYNEYASAIKRAPGTNEILSLTVDLNRPARRLLIGWQVRTVFGDTITDQLEQEVR